MLEVVLTEAASVDARTNAVTEFLGESSLCRARALDSIPSEERKGSLHGVPVSFKVKTDTAVFQL